MTASDPAAMLARAGLWAAELRERGQLDDAAASRLAQTLAESFGERLDQPEDPLLVVMLCGPTAVGKSSLINALAGAEISRPGLGAATRAAVLYVHEDDDPARLFAYSAELGSHAQQETALVRHRRNELLHKVLIDTPDIDSAMLQHRELTARLVHAADLVLFVTSPEKYKVLQSARWILAQRQQRAMAFVLNKWDRDALGLQAARRAEVADDFRAVLGHEGFPDALIFRVSALAQGNADIENDLPALRAWLEAGLSQSTAAVIRRRRLRAAWGRLAAAIEQAAPRPLSSHQLVPEIFDRLAARAGTAAQSVGAEALLLETGDLDNTARPRPPGLLGMSMRSWQRMSATASSLRAGMARLGGPPPSHDPAGGTAFGAAAATLLSETVTATGREAATAHIALGPVLPAWTTETVRLRQQLSLLPLETAADLAANAQRMTLRRILGTAAVYAIEALIITVLLVTVWRVGSDFVAGVYASGNLIFTVLALISMLVVIGHTLAAMGFPPLRQRLRRTVAQRARSLVKTASERIQAALQEHVTAIDRLAREARELLQQTDQAVQTLATDTIDPPSITRLFAQAPVPANPTAARPQFD